MMQEEQPNNKTNTYLAGSKSILNLRSLLIVGFLGLTSLLVVLSTSTSTYSNSNLDGETQIMSRLRRSLTEPSGEWSQCGGTHWTGSTTCLDGWSCVTKNEYYSQCKPVPVPDTWLPDLEGTYLADWHGAYFNATTKEFFQFYATNLAYELYRADPMNEFFSYVHNDNGIPNIGLLTKSDMCGEGCSHTALVRAGARSGEASLENWKVFENGARIESVYSVENGFGTSGIWKGTYRKVVLDLTLPLSPSSPSPSPIVADDDQHVLHPDDESNPPSNEEDSQELDDNDKVIF